LVNHTTIRVRYAETDQMGVVYHTNYIIWFEIGRTEWFRGLNQDYKDLEDQNIILPVIDVHCRYIKSALYDDLITIRTQLKDLRGVRLTFHYEILREDTQELLAEGETTHAFVDKDRKPIRVKQYYPELWKQLEKKIKL